MQYRNFTNGTETPSLLGMGCMRLPKTTTGKQEINYDEAARIVAYAYENGVNYFDTAYTYHEGTSEAFIGKALAAYPRSSYYLADKLPIWLLEKEEDVERIVREQLARCQTPYFDFYLCHAMDAERLETIKKLNVVQTLEALQSQGLIRHIGFSFHDTPDVLEDICNYYNWSFAQIQLNALDWTLYHSKEQYDILQQRGIPCIIMEPARGGRLADLGDAANALLKENSPNSIASWAIEYAATLPNVLTVLSGMSTLEQVQDNIKTMSDFTGFGASEQQVYQQALEIFKQSSTIACTACQYCMPCPTGVNIPGNFSLYNNYALRSSVTMEGFTEEYESFSATERAEACVQCDQCEKVCPQHLAIPGLLKKVTRMAVDNKKNA